MSQYQGVGFSESTNIPDDLFILNPSYQKMVTGKRNHAYLWRQYGWGGVILTLFFTVIILIFLPSFLTEIRLATLKTAQAKGEVINRRISKSSKSTTYYITYQFTNNERSYSREDSVSSGEYNAYELGGSVPVTFVVGDPDTAHIGEYGIRWSAMSPVLIMGGFILVLGIIWLVGQMPKFLRIRRMRQEGQLILGQLKSSSGTLVKRGSGKSRRTDYDVTIYCEFLTPTGKRIDTNTTFPRNDLKKKELQTRGTVAILYVSDVDYLVL